ncbi:3,4-dihydroxy-2-butanone-4-phosphate synthase [Rhodococcus sp. KBS0724]|uniref:3,4-dihydroxy-2-butanone-4-phosphate synthase n=1 Tax=Rhodococcus sp. KBS0724 TaxID=1179674 RepID=UPI00163DA6A4|nr:3,4-dihydroxy-2-butanone-4-phosphate synthase [Rhodococcus sp. KBS0724]
MSAPRILEHRLAQALEDLAAGRPVVFISDETTGGHVELILSAELASTSQMSFIIRFSSGYVTVALPPTECDRLELPAMPTATTDRPSFTVSVDTKKDTGTGISASDRAETARYLADPDSTPTSFTRPGHVVPLRSSPSGMDLGSISLTLARMAGLRPAVALAEMVGIADPTRMATGAEGVDFARKQDLVWLSSRDVEDIDRYAGVEILPLGVASEVESPVGPLTILTFRDSVSGEEHSALLRSDARPSRAHRAHIIGVRYEDPQWITLGLPWYVGGQSLFDMLSDLSKSDAGVVLFLRADKPSPALERAVARWLAAPGTDKVTTHTKKARVR